MPGVRSTDVPDRPFQLRSSTSNASRSHGSTFAASSWENASNCRLPSAASRLCGSIHRLAMVLRQSLLIGVPVVDRFRRGRRGTARWQCDGDACPIARPEQRLPARRLGRGVVEPQEMPGQLGGRRQRAGPSRRRCRRPRRRTANRRKTPRGCRAGRPPESAIPPDTRPAAARRSIATGRRRPGRGNRPADAKCSTHWANNSARTSGSDTSLRRQRSSQAVAAARRSATDVRWIVRRLFTGMVPRKEGLSSKGWHFLGRRVSRMPSDSCCHERRRRSDRHSLRAASTAYRNRPENAHTCISEADLLSRNACHTCDGETAFAKPQAALLAQ